MGEVAEITKETQSAPAPTWPQIVERAASKFNQIADRHKLVTWAEESQFALQAIQNNEKLAMCAPITVQNSIINVASIGLTLQPALGYAYLVPDSVKQKDASGREVWTNVCTLKVSFKGLLKIATDSGSIKWCKAEIVKEKDVFEYNGPCSLPCHIMQPFGDRGKTVGVYCVAKTHDGDYLVDIMDAAEIQKIRNAAKTKTVWDAWPDEMAKKGIIKRASKQWPKTDQSERLDQAIEVVNEYEGSAPIDVTPKTQALPESLPDITDALQAIRDCTSMDDLQTAFADMWRAYPQKELRAQLTAEKDAKKKEISQ